MTKPPAGYRPCVGLVLFNRDGLAFVGRRIDEGKDWPAGGGLRWQLPQGGIDAGETPLQAARRELREETNVTSVSLLAEAPEWLSYDLPPDVATQSWKGKWRGQAQKWFAFRFEGPDSEIDIVNPGDGHKAEFDQWRWARLDETPDLIVPFKRDVYRQVVRLFSRFGRPG